MISVAMPQFYPFDSPSEKPVSMATEGHGGRRESISKHRMPVFGKTSSVSSVFSVALYS